MNRTTPFVFLFSVLLALAARGFDFTRPSDRDGWTATHDVSKLESSAQGLVITIGGNDPYITGPARDYPAGQLLWMTVRLKSEEEGMAQIFYFDQGPSEEHSVRFPVRAGKWEEIRVPIPALGSRYRLRFDPPGTRGQTVLAAITVSPRVSLLPPTWPVARALKPLPGWRRLDSGEATLLHGLHAGEFVIRTGEKTMASGFPQAVIGYVFDGKQKWVRLSDAKTTVEQEKGSLAVRALLADPDGARWRIEQRFVPLAPGALHVTTSVSIDRSREVAFLPMLVMFPGAGAYGQAKQQALFPGLEYLDQNEPSSSEADIIGEGSKRQVPDTLRITIPLMVLVENGASIAVSWRPESHISALFDSPDRFFQSGAHVMGLLFPGSSGTDRMESSLLPYAPKVIEPGQSVTAEATIYAGAATDVTGAIKRYVALHPLPQLPDSKLDLAAFAQTMAAGWLDSDVRAGALFRHAVPGDFRPQPACDAAVMMDWIGKVITNPVLRERLRATAELARSQVQPNAYNSACISHVRYPVGSLLYGHVAENVATAREAGTALLRRFESDGTLLYRAGKVDYGKTHFAKDANGLTAQVVSTILDYATVCGEEHLIKEGVRLLRALDKFAGTAPRGAQTWECPLHTPDILASAYLLKAYVLGFELTGDEHFLEMARYWGWTGVPFVYLRNPAERDTGAYATIAVYGATSWVAPNWMGLPVQWCGLVYADALYRLNKYDSTGPWKQLADGIVISGVQQTFPLGSGSRQGLLPDSFVLRSGMRQNPAINPGTVQAPASRYFGRPMYDFTPCRRTGILIHAPGRISELQEGAKRASFRISEPVRNEYYALLSRCPSEPRVQVNGVQANVEWVPGARCAIIKISGDAEVQVSIGE